jgi:hypothetical protein
MQTDRLSVGKVRELQELANGSSALAMCAIDHRESFVT